MYWVHACIWMAVWLCSGNGQNLWRFETGRKRNYNSMTQKILLCHYCDLMDENWCMMNKYSELYWVAVRSLVYKVQQTVCQVCSLDNALLYKILYTPSLLQVIHILIPSDTWYLRWNTQFITYIRWHTISALHLNTYNLQQWLLLKVLTSIF